MAKVKKIQEIDTWHLALGEHIEKLILSKGYISIYDFWVQAIGEEISRSTLGYIIKARVDVKASTLKKIADALEIEPKDLFDF